MHEFNLALLDLTWKEILADVPVDPIALTFYAVCLFCGFLVWYGSRSGSGATAAPSKDGAAATPEPDARPSSSSTA